MIDTTWDPTLASPLENSIVGGMIRGMVALLIFWRLCTIKAPESEFCTSTGSKWRTGLTLQSRWCSLIVVDSGNQLLRRIRFAERPQISVEPQSQEVVYGETATLSATVAGTEPFVYQWRKNGHDIPRGTDSILTLARVNLSDAGQYSVVIRNLAGTVSSHPASISLAEPVPLHQFSPRFEVADFKVSFPGKEGVTYSIYHSVDLKNWTVLTNFVFTGDYFPVRNVDPGDHPFQFFRISSP